MSKSKEFQRKKRIENVMKLNPEMSALELVNHFKVERIPRTTVYTNYNRFKSSETKTRKPGSGIHQVLSQKTNVKILMQVW
jgi:hypothetical protein